jgi:1-pyrroline-4-hydroxy-2-carboxylate deaminase
MTQFPGIYVALITPFDKAGEVDYARLREHIEFLIESGIHGLIPGGSCGEYAALSDSERAKVVETVVQTANGRVPTVVGAAAPSTAKALGWVTHAKEVGAAGVMLLPPINYRPARHEIVEYYRTLASVGLPIIAYNNPFDTSSDLTPDLLAEIGQIPNVVAVKEFSGDVKRIPHILERTNLQVIVGADDLALEGLLAGGTGWIAGLTNILPRESVELYNLALAGKVAEANELYRKLLPFFRYDSMPIFVQVIKYAFELIGKPVGTTRPPRLPLPENIKAEVRAAFELASSAR